MHHERSLSKTCHGLFAYLIGDEYTTLVPSPFQLLVVSCSQLSISQHLHSRSELTALKHRAQPRPTAHA